MFSIRLLYDLSVMLIRSCLFGTTADGCLFVAFVCETISIPYYRSQGKKETEDRSFLRMSVRMGCETRTRKYEWVECSNGLRNYWSENSILSSRRATAFFTLVRPNPYPNPNPIVIRMNLRVLQTSDTYRP